MIPNQVIADEILTHALDLLRLEAGTARQVAQLLAELQKELVYRLANEDLTAFGKARLETLLKQTTETINLYYARVEGVVSTTTQGVAGAQASHMAATLNTLVTGLEATLPTETFLARLVSNTLIQGAPSAKWWKRQGQDVAFRFAAVLRQGLAQGQTTEQIVARVAGSARKGITGVMDIARRNARALVHSSIQTVANATRIETFKRNRDVVECLVWLATLDTHTCLLCAARDLHWYSLDDDRAPMPDDPNGQGPPWGDGPGAIHWGDRCVATIRMKPLKGAPPLPVGQRASVDGPIKGGTRFEAFLRRKGVDWQNEVLGMGRAQYWREHKLTLEQLLDLSGNPMTLAQLRAKYG